MNVNCKTFHIFKIQINLSYLYNHRIIENMMSDKIITGKKLLSKKLEIKKSNKNKTEIVILFGEMKRLYKSILMNS